MQKVVRGVDHTTFADRLSKCLDSGWAVVPGTFTAISTGTTARSVAGLFMCVVQKGETEAVHWK